MNYMLLIYAEEGGPGPAYGTPEFDKLMAGYNAFHQEVADAGVFVAGEPLHATESATTVRVRDNDVVTTDGPFAETKEQLGGFYLLDCKDLDEALGYAAKIPTAEYGSIEVRAVADMSADS